MSILVLNAGSSTLKFGLFDAEARQEIMSGKVDWNGPEDTAELTVRSQGQPERRLPCTATDHRAAARAAIDLVSGPEAGTAPITAVGHRVVHGGTEFRESVVVSPEIIKTISDLSELAPLHNPQAVAVLEAAALALPKVPHIAVFDTSFYANIPQSAAVYPLPYEWFQNRRVRKFGFHGISHAYCSGRAAEFLGRESAGLRLVICHLGNGCSATAVRSGVAIETTMGFTPLDGLMMGSRSGSVDPGLLLHLLQREGFTPEALDDSLNHKSGLLGVSGISSDFRNVEESASQGNERSRLALQIYAARVRSAIGSLAATLGGVDALVFTAGVGENSASLRAAACEGLGFMGIRLDTRRNAEAHPDADIAEPESPTRILILHTREELMIAREARRLSS